MSLCLMSPEGTLRWKDGLSTVTSRPWYLRLSGLALGSNALRFGIVPNHGIMIQWRSTRKNRAPWGVRPG